VFFGKGTETGPGKKKNSAAVAVMTPASAPHIRMSLFVFIGFVSLLSEDFPSRRLGWAHRSYQRFYGRWIARERCGQFLQTCQAETLQEFFRCRKAQPAVGAGEFLHKLEIPEFHNEPALVGVEKTVDFRLADWLLKGDAREHFKARHCHFKIPARPTLFA
jgi:hypothetical protein